MSMNFRNKLTALAIVLPALAACSTTTNPPGAALGSDRDPHGCIGSAGYRWCAGTKQCERPFELAMREDFPNTMENFDQFCADTRSRN